MNDMKERMKSEVPAMTVVMRAALMHMETALCCAGCAVHCADAFIGVCTLRAYPM